MILNKVLYRIFLAFFVLSSSQLDSAELSEDMFDDMLSPMRKAPTDDAVSLSSSSGDSEDMVTSLQPLSSVVINVDSCGWKIPKTLVEGHEVTIVLHLDKTKMAHFSSIGKRIQDFAEKFGIERICLSNGTSNKFNLIFPHILEFFKQGKIRQVQYFSKDDSKRIQVAPLKAFEDVQKGRGSSVLTDVSGKGCEQFLIFSPTKPKEVSSIREFITEVFKKAEYIEDQKYKDLYQDGTLYEILPQVLREFSWWNEKETTDADSWVKRLDKKSVKILKFSGEDLTDGVFQNLSETLMQFEKLTVLDLSSTLLSNESRETIIQLLQHPNLAFIDLTFTELSTRLFDGVGIWDELKRSSQQDLLKKVIWLGLDEHTVREAEIPGDCKEAVLKSHLQYSRISPFIKQLQSRKRIHEEISSLLKK